MKTSVSKFALPGAVFAAGIIALTTAVMADPGQGARMYRFTVTNATLGQPVAPLRALPDIFAKLILALIGLHAKLVFY